MGKDTKKKYRQLGENRLVLKRFTPLISPK